MLTSLMRRASKVAVLPFSNEPSAVMRSPGVSSPSPERPPWPRTSFVLADTVTVIVVLADSTVSVAGTVVPLIHWRVPSTLWGRMLLPWPPDEEAWLPPGWPAAEATPGRTRLAASAAAANERRERAMVMWVILFPF